MLVNQDVQGVLAMFANSSPRGEERVMSLRTSAWEANKRATKRLEGVRPFTSIIKDQSTTKASQVCFLAPGNISQ